MNYTANFITDELEIIEITFEAETDKEAEQIAWSKAPVGACITAIFPEGSNISLPINKPVENTMKKYTVRVMDTDMFTVEYLVEATSLIEAQTKALEGVSMDDVRQVMVCEQGEMVLIPETPTDYIDLTVSEYEKELTNYLGDQRDCVSPLKVMKSAAGYYVGHGYYDPEMGMTEADGYPLPWSRESDYFGTYEDAEKHLNYMQK